MLRHHDDENISRTDSIIHSLSHSIPYPHSDCSSWLFHSSRPKPKKEGSFKTFAWGSMRIGLARLATTRNVRSILSPRTQALCRSNHEMRRLYWSLPLVLSSSSFSTVHAFSSFSKPSIRSTIPSGVRYLSKALDEDYHDAEERITTIENEFLNEYSTTYHAPVMWSECIQALLECERSNVGKDSSSKKDEPLIFVDGTLGGGGHSAALLERLQPGDILLGCDVDPNALETASERLADYRNHNGENLPHFIPVQSNFGDLTRTLPQVLHPVTNQPILKLDNNGSDNEDSTNGAAMGVDGMLLDLGVSSHQIDTPERGFAFMKDGPLDMRMGTNVAGGLTAADLCNELDAKELQRIFSVFGDEPRSKTIANAIIQHRPLSTTQGLVEAIGSVTHKFAKSKRHGRTATCARIFQSLRIVVNQEDRVLERVLAEVCPALIRPGGRLVVLSYHSMEDRATKRIMRDGTLKRVKVEKDMYGNIMGPPKPFKPVGKRRTASEEEVAANSRARSASLRIAERMR
jgi:16S rRNA (cytosine1402-N4)-methyltransferase